MPLLKTPPESICILRLSAVGDVCNLVPIVRTLQTVWPQTKITWVIGQRENDLVGDIKGVEFIVYRKQSGLRGILRLRRKLTGRSFSVLLQMQAALRASLISLAIPARIRLGFHPQMAKDFQSIFTRYHTKPLTQPHVIDGFFGFLEALGIQQRQMLWDIPIPESARESVQHKMKNRGEAYIVISPCASVRYRNWRDWAPQKYARIIDHVWDQFGVESVLTGGPSTHEENMGARIVTEATHSPLNLIGQTSVKELMALIDRAQAVISPDSGPVHMANALGVPPMGLFTTSNPDRTGPYSHRKWVINAYPQAVQKAFGKPVHEIAWGKRVRDADAISLITADQVKKTLDMLLSRKNLKNG